MRKKIQITVTTSHPYINNLTPITLTLNASNLLNLRRFSQRCHLQALLPTARKVAYPLRAAASPWPL